MRAALLLILLAACGGSGDAGPKVPPRCEAAWQGLLHSGAAVDDPPMRERMVLACDHLSDDDLACAARAESKQDLLDGCMGLITALGAAAEEQQAHGQTPCRRAMRHAHELRGTDPDTLEDTVRTCEAAGVPPKILACMTRATTVGELDACDDLPVR